MKTFLPIIIYCLKEYKRSTFTIKAFGISNLDYLFTMTLFDTFQEIQYLKNTIGFFAAI